MPERFKPLPEHTPDENFYLHFGADRKKVLRPCEVIEEGEICLGIIGNGSLRPDKLLLLNKDRKPIYVQIPKTNEVKKLEYPGKSALIGLDPERCDKEILHNIVREQLNGEPDRRDHLYISTVSQIIAAGWLAFWAPLQLEHKIPHARLVADRTVQKGEDPTLEDTTLLAEAFRKLL